MFLFKLSELVKLNFVIGFYALGYLGKLIFRGVWDLFTAKNTKLDPNFVASIG